MACRRKMCKYYKKCIVRDANDGSVCDDYERSTEESINDDLNSINSEESKESIINMSNNSNFSY